MDERIFENKIRLRVNGILEKDESVLFVQLKSPVAGELIWMPPGGGVQFGEAMKAGLKREFLEETGLDIEPQNLAFVNELVNPPFHAVECYFWVQQTGGKLGLGTDPELPKKRQMLQDLQWIPIKRLDDYRIVPETLLELLQKKPYSAQKAIFSSQKIISE